MKSLLPLLTTLTLSTLLPQTQARSPGQILGHVKFEGISPDGPLNRWSYSWSGVAESNYGQEFLDAIRSLGGITHNWQCWYDDTVGYWRFDVSETWGMFGDRAVVGGVEKVTGWGCEATGVWGNICAVLHS
jgi:hypothetical protein